MPYKPRDIESRLQGKFGFSSSVTHSSDHRWYELAVPGLPPIVTKVSHGTAEIGSKLESKIARQLRVHAPFFREMMDCTKQRDDYIRQIRENPFPPWEKHF